jgi:hypothetical protein
MNQSLALSRQIAEDRRVRFSERFPKVASNRHERRTVRVAARRGLDVTDFDRGR